MSSDIERAKQAFRQLNTASRSLAELESIGNIANQLMGVSPQMRALSSFTEQVSRSLLAVKPVTCYADLAKSFEIPSILSELSPFSKMLADLRAQNERWQSITASLDSFASRIKVPDPAIRQIANSALVWDSGVSDILKRLGQAGALFENSAMFGRLLEPSNTLFRFTDATCALMRSASESRVLGALNASLVLADTQYLANFDTLDSFAATVVDDDGVSTSGTLTTPFVQQEELIAHHQMGDGEDIDLLVSQSPAAQAAEQARAVLNLTTNCNKASATKGMKEIFKPTTKLMGVYVDLPLLTPQDETSFGEFIDCLYFVAYEGAGKDNLRFLQKNGGPLSDADCEVVWCIKTLRNKWLRHDADHGKESDIEKSWKSLDACLQWLGIPGFPRSPSDYRTLHRRLLKEMEEFLTRLFQKI